MKNVLVIFGSPRAGSGSAALARALLEQKPADASVKEYYAYRLNAKPCLGCGGCDRRVGCVQRDLDAFYRDFEAADYVIFASPVYNGGFPAPLKTILDRFQCYYALRFAHGVRPPISKHRRAALVMTGGCEAQGSEHMAQTLRQQCTVLNAELAAVVTVTGTDKRELSEKDLTQARDAGAVLFQKREERKMLEDFLKKREPADEGDWEGYAALPLENGLTKLAFYAVYPYFDVTLIWNDRVYTDQFNDREPYDRMTHLFYLPTAELHEGDKLVVSGYDSADEEDRYYYETTFQPSALKNAEELKKQYNNHLTVEAEEVEPVADGLEYRHILLRDPQNAPVHAFLLKVDMRKNSLYVGTPNDDYKVGHVIAKVPEMIDSAVQNGQDVLAAMNADFFDMFGDGSPSGLCVKNGRVVANADSSRPFIGVKKDGAAVITTLTESPDLLDDLEQAAAGLEMILKDGELFEWGPLEPFSFVRHPRTAAGVTADGTVLLLEVDGRIPEYSNGASLIDLVEILKRFGAVRAVNLDGGGSSVTYTRAGDEFLLRSNPADLERPRDKLIRDEYNCLLVVKKK